MDSNKRECTEVRPVGSATVSVAAGSVSRRALAEMKQIGMCSAIEAWTVAQPACDSRASLA